MLTTALLVAIGFLLGSFPTGVVLSRVFTGKDVRATGSGNIGAANVARAAGIGLGLGVLLIDLLKGALPVVLGLKLGVGTSGLALVALFAVLGHDFSVFLAFRGGKGVATTMGVLLPLVPLATMAGIVTWLVVLLVSRYTSLASLLALLLLPVYAVLTGRPAIYAVLAFGLFILAALKHWENIARLFQGKETKFWLSSRPETRAG